VIETIEFGGEQRPVKYGWNALAIFGKLSGTGLNDLDKFDEDMAFGDVLFLIYAGLKEGARADKKEFKLTVENIGDFLDDNTDKVKEFMDVFTNQMPKSKNVNAL